MNTSECDADHPTSGRVFTRVVPVALGCLLLGWVIVTMIGEREANAEAAAKSTLVYVSDFELDAEPIESDPRSLRLPPPA